MRTPEEERRPTDPHRFDGVATAIMLAFALVCIFISVGLLLYGTRL